VLRHLVPPRVAGWLGRWLGRWSGLLPLFLAEMILWLGFGAVLPILPIYFVDKGVDLFTLGVIMAAWPAARLVGEPLFGMLADRTPRVPLMVIGLVAAGIFAVAPIAVHGAEAFIVLRALSGLAASLYDPAARGYLVDASPRDRRGEAFGLYSAAQMGGLLLGPAVGGVSAALLGRLDVVFVLAGLGGFVAALAVALTVHEKPRGVSNPTVPRPSLTEIHGETPGGQERAAEAVFGTGSVEVEVGPPPPISLLNRAFLAAVILNFGAFFAGGTYEVIWSLFMRSKGFGLGFIGFTFALYGLPVLFISPVVGRLVDRRGSGVFVFVGAAGAVVSGLAYTVADGPAQFVAIVLGEASAWALISPALYAVVALGSPAGRASTAQGVFGAVGTIGFIVSSLVAGPLFEVGWQYPFFLFAAVMAASLVAALAVGGPALAWRARAGAPDAAEAAAGGSA